MNYRVLILATIAIVLQTNAQAQDSETKTVIGPTNVYLYDGANALMAGDGEMGVRLTLRGLEFAQGHQEKKTAHSNLCAGYILLKQAETALEHCNWVLDIDPDHWRTYNNRALVYLQLERYDESAADVRKGQALNPRSENLKEVKGRLLDEVDPVSERISIDDRRGEPAPLVEPPKE